jgi:N-acetylneuraminic acid mutarotase
MLTFWHQYGFEAGNYDGGVLETSTDGGTTWADVGLGAFLGGGYTAAIASGTSNPLAGRPGWVGNTLTYRPVTVTLAALIGQPSVKLRFRLGTDNFGSAPGWWIDDVRLTVVTQTGCGAPTPTLTFGPTSSPRPRAAHRLRADQPGRVHHRHRADQVQHHNPVNGCAVVTCPGNYVDDFHYDAYPFANNTGATQCVTIAVDSTGCGTGQLIWVSAYLGSFNPTNGCTNFLASYLTTTSGSFSFSVPDGQTFWLTFEEGNAGGGCLSYSAAVSAAGTCATPTVTRTPTATGTPTPGPSPTATACIAGTWRAEPTMTTPRKFAAGAVITDQLYIFTGSTSGSGYITQTERFDPGTTTWTGLAPIPTPHSQAHVAVVNGRAYLPGGYAGGQLSSMQIYNPATNSWAFGANLPAARSGAAVAALNGKVYVVAGFGPPVLTPTNTTYEYDPLANSYMTKAPLPTAVGNVAGVAYNGEIYVLGGSTFVAYAYTPGTDTWRALAPGLTSTFCCGAAFVLGNEIWLVGGDSLALSQQVQIYNPAADAWRWGPAYTNEHQGAAVGVINNRAYVAGGGPLSGATNIVESVVLVPCGTSTPAPTTTNTATATATSTSVPPTKHEQCPTDKHQCRPADDHRRRAHRHECLADKHRPSSLRPLRASRRRPRRCPRRRRPAPSPSPMCRREPTTTGRCNTSTAGASSAATPTTRSGRSTRPHAARWSRSSSARSRCPSSPPRRRDNRPSPTCHPRRPSTASSKRQRRPRSSAATLAAALPSPATRRTAPTSAPTPTSRAANSPRFVAVAAGWLLLDPATGNFTDVLPGTAFYTFIETAYCKGIISGYTCGGPTEPCDAQNRPYFRPFANAVRAQISKIVYGALTTTQTCGP